jgi:short subunit dehydrogenase-like uncharacterized protein
MHNFLIYGANGYTGQLIVEEAVNKGFKPILGGRNKVAVEALAQKYQLESRVFDLSDKESVLNSLQGIQLVIHCAGPFQFTTIPMVEACLATKTHYIDITGEIWVFETLQRYDKAAKDAGIMLLPGAGFDVVPTDCLAAMLKDKLPTATHLELAFTGIGGGPSHGTALTAVENIHRKNYVREKGKLAEKPQGHAAKKIDFGEVQHHCMSIPWGDISTAYVSTGIPNIIVYMGLPKKMLKWVRLSNYMRPVLKMEWVKNMIRKRIKKQPAGPSAEARAKGKSCLWGQVSDEKGNKVEARLVTPEGYTLTARTAVLIASKIVADNYKTGFQTPTTAYGFGLILEVEGVSEFS